VISEVEYRVPRASQRDGNLDHVEEFDFPAEWQYVREAE
jgi:hypothetical protein